MADDRTVVVVEDFFVKTEEVQVRENIALVVAEEEAIVVFTLT